MLRIGWRPSVGALALVLVAALAVPVVVLDTEVGAAPGGSAQAGRATGPLRWLTLITGDRVALRPGAVRGKARADDVVVRPAAGRERARFLRMADHGDTLVVPADVASLVSAGRLDRRLFNVTKLLKFGYDDRSRADLPLIVSYAGGAGAAPAARARVAASGARPSRDLPSIGGAAVRADKATAGRFWAAVRGDLAAGATGAARRGAANGLSRIWLDGPIRATLDQSVPQVGAPAAWQAGFTGAGTTVAVLDSGLDQTHPDLADAVAGARDFTDDGVDGTDDGLGHGTHVASIVTGNGAASAGRYVGVAPDTKLLVGKVLDDFGGGDESWIIAGMEWAAAQHARVVNMSFGSSFAADGTDPIEMALTRLTAGTGPLFVVAAGNDGPSDETIGSPAEVDAALTVGAVTKQDDLADFSSRGPARTDKAIKPEITAPGADIVAARAAHAQIGDPVGDAYLRLSGTSMATPHVAGAAAILAGQHPDWTAQQLKAGLVGSAAPRAGVPVDQQGAGRLDVARAVSQPAYATPASLSDGVARWPHADDPLIRQTVTYHNTGTQPLSLDLGLDVRGPAGDRAPAGMFTLGAANLTVPAGGTAAVPVTVNTTGSGADGRYSGLLTATGTGTAVRTPIAVTKEVESYDVRLRVLDRRGQLTPQYGFTFIDLDQPRGFSAFDASGSVVARLPKGRYYLDSFVQTQIGPDPFDLDLTELIEPTVTVTKAGAMVLDARRGKAVGATVDRPEARPGLAVISSERTTAWGPVSFFLIAPNFDNIHYAPSASTAPAGQFRFGVLAELARPDRAGGFTGSPYAYYVSWSQDRAVPSVLVRHLPDRGLAVAAASIAGPTPGRIGQKNVFTAPLPAKVTEFYTPGMLWFGDLFESDSSGELRAIQLGAGRQYAAGRAPVERWNLPVFGPAFPSDPTTGPFVGRVADTIGVDVPLWSDQVFDHYGFSQVDAGSTALFRDGVLVGRTDFDAFGDFSVPAEPATYRLEAEANRAGFAPLSTRVSGVWTFRSGHVAGEEPAALALAAVRFAPNVDDRGAVKAGRRVLPVPVYLQRQSGGGFGRLASLTVQASFDDGTTWQPVTLSGSGDRRVAMVRQPAGTGFVSLRATASDPAGNSVQETIIRAYALR